MDEIEAEIYEIADGWFLRNDTPMRKNWEWLTPAEHEAYSLFRQNPYGREEVFCGSFEWAKKKALDNINNGVYNEL